MFRIRLIFLLVFIAAVSHSTGVRADGKKYGPGVTDTEIKIGQTMPYGGPASAFATCGISHQRVFKSINVQGGINGR